MEFPQVFVYGRDDDEEAAAQELAKVLDALEIEAPLVLASRHGATLASRLRGPRPAETPLPGADQQWALELGRRAKDAGADAVVAIGGGRCLDVGKLAAARAGLTIVTVPTQLSHDGLCSPVAVVPGDDGRAESVGAIAPRGVFVSLPTLWGAPVDSARAGIGDLLANPLALRDWALAAERGLESIDQRAWDMSAESFEAIRRNLDDGLAERLREPAFLRVLADALVLSGMAMICAGTSRPASGAEHEVSHAIDQLHPGRAAHGQQVAFGCMISVALYGDDVDEFRARLRMLGLPQHPADLRLSDDEMTQVLIAAPETRPGRFTVLEEANLDQAAAEKLVKELWGE